MKELTEKQQAIYDEIKEGVEKNRVPSIDTLGEETGITPQAIYQHIILIEKKGYLKRIGRRQYEL